VPKDRRLLTQLKDGGLQRNDVSGVQLVMKVGLRVYDGKRHLSSTNFFSAKTKTDHDAEHAVANCREIVLHIHVAKVVTVCWSDGGAVCLYKDRHAFYDSSKASRRARVMSARNHALLRSDASAPSAAALPNGDTPKNLAGRRRAPCHARVVCHTGNNPENS
jgi:hypothetical protein